MTRSALALVLTGLVLACDPVGTSLDGGRCTSDRECDDGVFCNGVEHCDPRLVIACLPGVPPCAEGCEEGVGCVGCMPADADGDGDAARGCGGVDCDDTEARTNPRARETCNEIDDDCDGRVDEELPSTVFLDGDGDGHGDPMAPLAACTMGVPTALSGDDCDDGDGETHPGSLERCNGIDDDCSGATDDGADPCALPGASSACVDGSCVLVSCSDSFADCNERSDDGCEVDLRSDALHCAACDHRCLATDGLTACVAGLCETTTCVATEHACGGVCVSVDDPTACGAGCVRCAEPPSHGHAICQGGWECGVVCDPDYWSQYSSSSGTVACVWTEARLLDLVSSTGTLVPAFDSDQPLYTLLVPLATDRVTFTAVADARSELTVTAAGVPVPVGSPSEAIPLVPGVNVIDVSVRPRAPYWDPYRVYVVRGNPVGSVVASSDPRAGEHFGAALALDGDTLAVGVPDEEVGVDGMGRRLVGAVYLLSWDGTGWRQDARLVSPEPTAGDLFGRTLALDGDVLAIGAPRHGALTRPGAVFVFRRTGSAWNLESELVGPAPDDGDDFGGALALEGDRIVVGASGDDGGLASDPDDDSAEDSGAVQLFVHGTGGWVLDAFLKPDAIGAGDRFGSAVALLGDTLLVGAHGHRGAAGETMSYDAGAAYVFQGAVSGWSQRALLRAATPAQYERFGASVAITASLVLVGAPGTVARPDGATPEGYSFGGAGAVHVFARTAGTPTVMRVLFAPNADLGDGFGATLTAHDDDVLVGAPGEDALRIEPGDDSGTYGIGAAYLFRSVSSAAEVFYLKSTRARYDGYPFSFGMALALDDVRALAGSPTDSWMHPTSGGGGVSAGAVFEFALP